VLVGGLPSCYHNLSSIDNSKFLNLKFDKIGHHWKSILGYNAIVEVTKASKDMMAKQMKAIAIMEQNKIGVQLKKFSEQMEYQQKKDIRLHENVKVVYENFNMVIENAKMAIEKTK
jgi:hypothetical protein